MTIRDQAGWDDQTVMDELAKSISLRVDLMCPELKQVSITRYGQTGVQSMMIRYEGPGGEWVNICRNVQEVRNHKAFDKVAQSTANHLVQKYLALKQKKGD